MIGRLSTTTDPVRLIPGSFATLFADAQDLRTRAREVLDEHDRPISRDVAAWVGDAAERCDVRRANVAKGLTGVAQVFDVAAAVLEAHAEVLRWGQGRAALAIELWAAGVAKAADAGIPTLTMRPQQTGPFGQQPAFPETDPGAILRRSAEHVLDVAWREVHASEAAACQALDGMSEGLPDGSFHLDDFAGGIGEWVAGLAQLSVKFTGARFLLDPDGMIEDGQNLGQGVLDTFDVDDEGYPVWLDRDTLHDNPGRWWGHAAPDIALAALPAGVAATRSEWLARLLGRGGEELVGVGANDGLFGPGGRWSDPGARQQWVDDLVNGPDAYPQRSTTGWADYQRRVAGPIEYDLRGGGEVIRADGIAVDADKVVAVDAKFTDDPLRSPYAGTADPRMQDILLRDFDDEVRRYGAVMDDAGNPVGRLRIIANTPETVEFMVARARQILGPNFDVVGVLEP